MRQASEWDERYAASELVWSAGPNRFVAEEFDRPAPRGSRALDLACGEGRNAIWLAERGWAVEAVDFSRVGLDKGATLAHAAGVDVSWVHADVAAFVPDARAYGAVVVAYLHTAPEVLDAAFRHGVDAVRDGGVLLAVGHDRDNLEHGHGGPQDPAVLWTVGRIRALVDGLEIDRAEQVRRTVATDEGEAQAIDTLVRARRTGSVGAR